MLIAIILKPNTNKKSLIFIAVVAAKAALSG